MTLDAITFPQAFFESRHFGECLEHASVSDIDVGPILGVDLAAIFSIAKDPGLALYGCCVVSAWFGRDDVEDDDWVSYRYKSLTCMLCFSDVPFWNETIGWSVQMYFGSEVVHLTLVTVRGQRSNVGFRPMGRAA